MSTILKITGYDDPSLEGGSTSRQKGDPTAEQIKARARQVRTEGFYGVENGEMVWHPAWDEATFRARRLHNPGEPRCLPGHEHYTIDEVATGDIMAGLN